MWWTTLNCTWLSLEQNEVLVPVIIIYNFTKIISLNLWEFNNWGKDLKKKNKAINIHWKIPQKKESIAELGLI